MADNKKYYYLKLKDNFYDTDAMIILESMENGYLYSNILMKLYLRSLKNNGKLMFNDKIPYNLHMLSKIVRHNIDVVEKAIKIFKELELIDMLDNGAIYISDIQNYIGESSTEADRKRIYRNTINEEKVTIGQMSDKCTPEIEKEKEKEINICSSENERDNSKSTITEEMYINMANKIYEYYPKKKGKQQALKSIINLLKGNTKFNNKKIKLEPTEIANAILKQDEYIEDNKIQEQFIPYASTFFNSKIFDFLEV